MKKQNNSLEANTLFNKLKSWLYNLFHNSSQGKIEAQENIQTNTIQVDESSKQKGFFEEYKDKEMRRQYLLDLQRKYKNKQIREDEMLEEDRISLENLYIEQNNELKRKIRSYDSKIKILKSS